MEKSKLQNQSADSKFLVFSAGLEYTLCRLKNYHLFIIKVWALIQKPIRSFHLKIL